MWVQLEDRLKLYTEEVQEVFSSLSSYSLQIDPYMLSLCGSSGFITTSALRSYIKLFDFTLYSFFIKIDWAVLFPLQHLF